jgi:membrane protein YdbS with pleckstrin-like domain
MNFSASHRLREARSSMDREIDMAPNMEAVQPPRTRSPFPGGALAYSFVAMPNETESPVWSGCPSQWVNFGTFDVALIVVAAIVTGAILWQDPRILIALVLPVSVVVWKMLIVRSMRIDVSSERITTTTGVFSRRRTDMELYRVKDTTLLEPFLLRIVGLGNIRIDSSDRSSPSYVIPAVRNAESLRQQIRTHVERLRLQRGVREMDMDIERM